MASVIKADVWKNSAGTTYNSVLNVYSANKTNTQATVGGGWVDISGLSITLTPKFTTSRFLIFYSVFLLDYIDRFQAPPRNIRQST